MYTNNIFKRIQQIKEKSESNKTLTSVDFTPNNSDIIGVARQAAPTTYSVDDEIAKKYNKYGLTWTPNKYYSGKLDIELADAQSNWEKLGNALAQTAVSEILLGTGIAFSDVFDAIGQAIHASDYNYSNPLTETLTKWQEEFRNNIAPIYSKPNSGFGEGTDFGWWMQNIPSIASSLTLLIPSTAISKSILAGVKGLSSATKLAKKWDNISDTTKKIISGGSEITLNAGISRTLENYQEARQVYNEVVPSYKEKLDEKVKDGTYEEFINHNATLFEGVDTTNTLEVAKAIGRASADRTFALDYANSIFDVLQLLALRNVKFNALGKSPKTVASRRYDINARKYAGKYKTKEELNELLSNRKTIEKVKEKFGDAAYFIGTTGVMQATEGVEEAWNYIASQEGLHLASTILDLGVNNTTTTERLDQYFHNPVLWENAFWGLMGGITFNVIGSGLSETKRKHNRKKLEQELSGKLNQLTGENTNLNPLLDQFTETADTHRVKSSIDARIMAEADFYTKMEALNKNNEDPFVPGRIIESEEEKAVVRERLLQTRRQNIILNAMDSGTLDMVEAYFTDKNVQQAMVDMGLVNQEDIAKIESEDLNEINNLKDKYVYYKKIIKQAAKHLKQDEQLDIPVEFLQIINRNNIENELQIERLKDIKSRFERNTNALTGTLANSLDPAIDYKGMIKLQVLTTTLGQLQAKLDRLSNDKDMQGSFIGQEEIKKLKTQIDRLNDNIIYDAGLPGTCISRVLAAIEGSYATKLDDTGNFVQDTKNDKLIAFRKALNNKDLDFFKNLDTLLTNIIEEDLDSYNTHVDNIIQALGDRSDLNIFKISKELGSNYATLAALDYNIAELETKVALTDSAIAEEAKALNNVMNEIRARKIEECYTIIKALADKYGSENISKYINAKYQNDRNVPEIPNITPEDKQQLDLALEVLNITAPINQNVVTNILNILKHYDAIRNAQRQSSFSSQISNNGTQGNVSINNTQPQSNAQNTQPSGATRQTQPQSQPQPTAQATTQNTFGLNLTVPIVTSSITGNTLYRNRILANGDILVTFEMNESANYNYFNNSDLFVQEAGVSLMDNNWYIKEHPILNNKQQVVNPGVLAVINQDDSTNQQTSIDAVVDDTPTSSTGGVEPNVSTPIDTPVMPSDDEEIAPIDNDDVSDEDYAEFQIVFNITKEANAIFLDWASNDNVVITDKLLEEARSVLTERFNKDNNPKYKQIIDDEINKLKNKAEEFDIYKPIAEAIEALRKASISENDITVRNSALSAFNNAMDELISANKDILGFETIDGKVYVNIESLLRFCNKVSENKLVANILYDQLMVYIKSSDKYVIVDNNPSSVLQKIRLSRADREKLEKTDSQSIGFDDFCNKMVVSDERNAAIDQINSLNIGDNIDFSFNGRGIIFSKNGVNIGYIHVPNQYKPGTDHIMQVNEGWITDIKSVNGVIESDFQNLLINWIRNPNDDPHVTELYNTILEYAYETNYTKRTELLIKFTNNPVYKQAVESGYANNFDILDYNSNANPDEIRLEHLAKLWRYIKDIPYLGDDIDMQQEIETQTISRRAMGIKSWFSNKVFPSFNFAIELANTKTGTLIVSDITEGSRIQTDEAHASIPKKALGSRYKYKNGNINPNTVKVGAAVRGNIYISGNPNTNKTALLEQKLVDNGNTFVLLLNKNGSHDVVHAFPQKPSSTTLSRSVKPLLNAINQEFTRLLEVIETDDTSDKQTKMVDIQNFLYALFGVTYQRRNKLYNNYTGLFAPIKGILAVQTIKENNAIVGWHINSDDVVYSIRREGNKIVIKDAVSQKNSNVTEMLNSIFQKNCYFNVGVSFIEMDCDKQSPKPFFRITEKGKFVVSIGNVYEKEYKSYNDFVLNEGLIKLATTPASDGFGNHNRFGETSGPIQTIKVKHSISVSNTSPVEDVEDRSAQPINTFVISEQAITNAMDVNKDNEGYGIAKLLFNSFKTANIKGFTHINESVFNNLTNIYKNLFPKNVIFVNENVGAYAHANVTNKTITLNNNNKTKVPAGYIVIGKEWFTELVNSGTAGRKEAIRKLIHENIHLLLSNPNNAHYIEDIRKIFNEFAKSNKDPNAAKYLFYDANGKPIPLYYDNNGVINNEGLEEFLVESLTSGVLANALNNIKSTDGKERKTLFNKIIDFLLRLFDWEGVNKINRDSLYAENLSIVQSLFGEDIELIEDKNDISTPKPVQSDNQTETTPSDNNIADTTNDIVDTTNDNADKQSTDTTSTSNLKNNEEQEMQQIKDQAIANGTFMKAPNGKHTNLTERQWLQVRIKAFKDWFGDWINPYKQNVSIDLDIDRESADMDGFGSMVNITINNNGNKIVIGTIPMSQQIKNTKDFKFTKYVDINSVAGSTWIDNEFRNKGYGKAAYWELGMWLSRNGSILRSAKDYARTEDANRVWKSLEKDGFAKKVNDRYEFVNTASKVVDENGEPLVVYHGDDFEFDGSSREEAVFKQIYASNKPWGKHKKDYPIFLNMRNPRVEEWGFTDDFSQEYENVEREVINKGYDGAIGYYEKDKPKEPYSDNIREFYVISPNQIKLAEGKYFKSKDDSNDIDLDKEDMDLDDFTEFANLDDDYIPSSLIRETSDEIGVANINNFVNKFPISEQPAIISRINNGEISIICS